MTSLLAVITTESSGDTTLTVRSPRDGVIHRYVIPNRAFGEDGVLLMEVDDELRESGFRKGGDWRIDANPSGLSLICHVLEVVPD